MQWEYRPPQKKYHMPAGLKDTWYSARFSSSLNHNAITEVVQQYRFPLEQSLMQGLFRPLETILLPNHQPIFIAQR